MTDLPPDVSFRVRAFISEELLVEPPERPLEDGTSLLNGLLDSAELMQLVMHLEEEFGVEFDDAEITRDHLATVGAIERMIVGKLASSSSKGTAGPSMR